MKKSSKKSGKTMAKKSNKLIDSKQNRIILILSVVIFAFIGLMMLLPSNAAPGGKGGGKSGGGSTVDTSSVRLYTNPSSGTTNVGSTVSFDVYVDSLNYNINGVQANLSYPTNLFEFVSIDTTGSALSLALQTEGGNGTVKIARGTYNPVNGVQKIARVNLKAISSNRKARVDFLSSSIVTEASSSTDILQNSYGTAFNIKR